MMKTQINYRIDHELLNRIKAIAQKQNIPYTQWINEACLKYLGDIPITDELYHDLYKRLKLEIINEIQKDLEELTARLTAIETQLEPAAVDQPPPDQTGLTHAELARQLGVSPSTISRWSTGKRKPPEDLKYRFDQTLKLWVKHET